MVVGIDVHKRTHVAALLDERGGALGTLGFANSPEGMRRLRAWLVAHDAGEAVVGVESPAGYGRLLVASLEAAGHEVLNVPAWRTHRERRRHGPGKTDPGDAIAVAQVVLRRRAELGPALEPELVRAVALLELQRRRLVRDRTQAIQRLRADWNQVDPVGEARVVNLTRQRELRRLKRISFGDGVVEQVAARCIRDLARDIEDLNQRIAALDAEIAQLLQEHGNPVGDLTAPGRRLPRRSSLTLATSAASATPPPSPASAAPRRSPVAQAEPPAATGSTAAATANSTPPFTASRSSRLVTTRQHAPTSRARSPRARHRAKRAAR
jgi:transposase